MNTVNTVEELSLLAQEMRYAALEMSYNCGEPTHLGGGLSIIDIMAVLYGNVLKKTVVSGGEGNRFILSKGHGVLGLLSALYCVGRLSHEEIMTFQTNGSKYIAHPIMNKEVGIESSNGSLGQGLSMGVGIALSYKKRCLDGSIFVLVGDGECYEGSIWEAAISAVELELDNLVVIIDCNGFQNDGAVNNNMNHNAMKEKWEGFGFNCVVCDGHNINDLLKSLSEKSEKKPKAVIALTVKGKGVDFMENNNEWHHNRLSQKLFEESKKSLKSQC